MADPTAEEVKAAEAEERRVAAEAEIARAQAASEAAAEASEDEDAVPAEFGWFISNRKDDRVVLFEQDDQHPDGECFIGGSAPDFCARTGDIERLLREGMIVEIPEPPDSRKKPIVGYSGSQTRSFPDAPGEPIRLGRALDPELVPEKSSQAVRKAQSAKPNEVPVPRGVERVRGPRTENAPK